MVNTRKNRVDNFDNSSSQKSSQNRPFSDGQTKKPPTPRSGHHWLTIVFGLIALVGVLAAVGVTLVVFVFLPAAKSTATTSTTTSRTSTTAVTCFTVPSPQPSNSWFLVGNMSDGRFYHTATLLSQDNSVFIAGGSSTGTGSPVISTDRYIPSTGCFQSIGNMPRGRYQHTADQLSLLSGLVLLAGGAGTSGILNIADLFDPFTGNSITITMTAVRFGHTSALVNSSRLVLIGAGNAAASNTGDMLTVSSPSSFASVSSTMISGRTYHSTTRLGPTSDVFLIAGGTSLQSAELYHGPSNTFIPLGSGVLMSSIRSYHTATYLPSPIHQILITGGSSTGSNALNTMDIFDITSLVFISPSKFMSSTRMGHTATLLPNGKVLLVGGLTASGVTNSCELIDPTNHTFSSTPVASLQILRYLHTATLLPYNGNSTVLVCGGYHATLGSLTSCELYFI